MILCSELRDYLRAPSSRSPATVQETPVTRRQLEAMTSQVTGQRLSDLPDKERFPAPDINKKSTEKVARNLKMKCNTLLQPAQQYPASTAAPSMNSIKIFPPS